MVTTLLSLPPELRLLILVNLSSVPSRHITLRPGHSKPLKFTMVEVVENVSEEEGDSSPRQIISLCVLGTCKRVYGEGSDVFWRHNTFLFKASDLRLALQAPAFNHIQHIQLELDVADEISYACQYLRQFAVWARDDNLEFITFKGITGRSPFGIASTPGTFLFSNSRMANFKELLSADLGGIDIAGMGVQKKFDMTKSMRERPIIPGNRVVGLEVAVYNMHLALGGEIWVEGILIWKDGVQTGQIPR